MSGRHILTSLAVMFAAVLFTRWLMDQVWHADTLWGRELIGALFTAVVVTALAVRLVRSRARA